MGPTYLLEEAGTYFLVFAFSYGMIFNSVDIQIMSETYDLVLSSFSAINLMELGLF